DIAEFNALTALEYERIRDFLVLHYKLQQRDDSPFWQHCQNIEVPDSLQRKLDLFASNGRIYRYSDELFAENSWLQVMLGQGLMPRGNHPFADLLPEADVQAHVNKVEQVVARCAQAMPTHADFIAKNCASNLD
ncbi:MAG TPA: tryptophan 7-halogenase, partial [Burkholderiaceae bacterium]